MSAQLTRVFALLALLAGCADTGIVEEGLCTLERDPGGFYCRSGVLRFGSAEAVAGVARSYPGPSAHNLIWLTSSVTDTLNPNGRDVSFMFRTYDSAAQRIHYLSKTGIFNRFGHRTVPLPCGPDDGLMVLDSTILVPDAIARYEEVNGLLILDEFTRTAFRMSHACFFSATGEDSVHWAVQRWTEGSGNTTWFVRYTSSGDFIDVLGPCEDFRSPSLCLP